jgi:hypothetical protein
MPTQRYSAEALSNASAFAVTACLLLLGAVPGLDRAARQFERLTAREL